MVNIRKSHLRKSYLVGLPEVGLPIVVTTGNKPSSDIGSALVSAMYGRSSELGLYLWGPS